MQEKARKYDGMGNVALTGEKGVKFFRRGKAGSYKDEIPAHLIAYFTEDAKAELEKLGYEIEIAPG